MYNTHVLLFIIKIPQSYSTIWTKRVKWHWYAVLL